MPILHKKINGGYIIKSRIQVQNITFQVRDKGVNILQQCGLKEGDGIPKRLLRYMWDKDLIFTQQSGVHKQTTTIATYHSSAVEDKSRFLVIRENGDSWDLAIQFDELPREWMQEVVSGYSISTIPNCGFSVDNMTSSTLSITKLWPGKGGCSWQVVPHAEPYTIEPIGTWPPVWDISSWTKSVSGLNTEGTLFKEEEGVGGVRLVAGKSIEVGTTCYFVFHKEARQSLQKRQILPMPQELQARSIGMCDEWEAWAIQLPIEAKKQIDEWCFRIGYSVKKVGWRLKLVSPLPRRYSAMRAPTIPLHAEAVIAIISPPTTIEKERAILTVEHNNKYISTLPINMQLAEVSDEKCDEIQYICLSLQQVGIYRLQLLLDEADDLLFEVAPASISTLEDLISQPSALEVRVEIGTSHEQGGTVHSLYKEKNELYLSEGEAVTLHIVCPIPVDVYWSCGQKSGRRRSITTEEVTAYLLDHIPSMFSSGNIFTLQIDAHSFGNVQFQLHPILISDKVVSDDVTLRFICQNPAIKQRIHWLVTAIPDHLHRGVSIAPLPPLIKASLAQLREWPEGRKLADLKYAPGVFLPHLTELVRMLDRAKEGFS